MGRRNPYRVWPSMPTYGDLATVRPEPFEVRVDDDGRATIVATLSVRMDVGEAVDEVERLEDEVEDLREDADAVEELERCQVDLEEARGAIERARDSLASGSPSAEVFTQLNGALPFSRELKGAELSAKMKGLMAAPAPTSEPLLAPGGGSR